MIKTLLGKNELRLTKGQKPAAIKTYWRYDLYGNHKIYIEDGLCGHCRACQKHTAMLVEAEQAAQE